MSKADEQKLREQRLAAKLRENLKRRKGQARQRGLVADSVKPEPGAGESASSAPGFDPAVDSDTNAKK